jgi:hypothetical protein
MPQAIHIDGPLSSEPIEQFVVEPGESLKQVLDRLGVTALIEEVPAKPPRLSPEAAKLIRDYKREEADSVLAVFWRYHSIEAEEFGSAEKAEQFLDGGEEYGTLAGEAVVVGDEILVRD